MLCDVFSFAISPITGSSALINHPITYNRIVIPTLQIIHSDFVVVVVSAVTIRIYRCNRALGSIAYNSTDTPRIVGIFCDNLYILIDNRNDIALQILYKVVTIACRALCLYNVKSDLLSQKTYFICFRTFF